VIYYTVEQNDVVERWNRTLLDMISSMMTHADLAISLLGDALFMGAYIFSYVPSRSVSAISYELWFGKRSSLDHLCP